MLSHSVSGTLLAEAFGNYTTLVTNGTGVYATTAQEDNATLEGILAFRPVVVDRDRTVFSVLMCLDSDASRGPLQAR